MNTAGMMNLRIDLNGSKPPIWRRVVVPSDITLGELHEVIQIVMGWTNSHLHQFILRGKGPRPVPRELSDMGERAEMDEIILPDGRRGRILQMNTSTDKPQGPLAKPTVPNPDRYFVTKVTPWGEPTEMEGEDEDAVTFGELCQKVKSKLIYEYDFGDGWEHTIEVQKIIEPQPGMEYPVCLAGKKACPPEDCGGMWGYYELLEAVADPAHERHDELSEWLGDGFDPDVFNLGLVNAALAKWRKARV